MGVKRRRQAARAARRVVGCAASPRPGRFEHGPTHVVTRCARRHDEVGQWRVHQPSVPTVFAWTSAPRRSASRRPRAHLVAICSAVLPPRRTTPAG